MAEYEGVDALLAAITDEALPEGAGDDPEFLAEHRSAVADVALLREQLAVIGDALADRAQEAKPVPVRAPRKRTRRPEGAPRNRGRRPLALVLGTLVAATVAAMVVGMGWILAHNGAGASDSSGAKAADSGTAGGGASLSAPGYLACARLVAEGTVAHVEPLPGTTENRITLHVDRYYKPEKGRAEVVLVLDEEVAPRPREGERVLVAVQGDPATPTGWTTGDKAIADERAWIVKALPASRTLTCP
ncbi:MULTISPECIES: hypothetical protein [Streptomyces]|uniref:Uncharacterized protein n=1 Tax=Streptomyces mirabilis TaxID=68239 RepID=A0ABU3UTT4_9ACTN|nr:MULTISPECIES: hypothetical protein [Streptomyces]MCX4608838.1 hypothetical protein [Streptomyces mirabilis]MCX5349290.1 hypothetical protein [Streptomyces mirabilis]MDU8997331.1 hypothetical protein [Streptomyces mirabilis]NMI58349.1 hypothetical protein [Streptomyces sp. RLA2-12]QDN57701.1 hypothetical protein FNV67_22285 [Streptomyces sp. S1D4-20]